MEPKPSLGDPKRETEYKAIASRGEPSCGKEINSFSGTKWPVAPWYQRNTIAILGYTKSVASTQHVSFLDSCAVLC